MMFNKHPEINGLHALLGPSKHSWIRYSDDKLQQVYLNSKAAEMGTKLHAFYAEAIKLGERLAKAQKTVPLYVNDSISFKMAPEQPLIWSKYCFGTADAISFRGNELRIHDLKTGVNPASMEQLEIYAALFCLEYHKKPKDIFIELRIYQNNEVFVENPDPEKIEEIMTIIKHFTVLLESWEVMM